MTMAQHRQNSWKLVKENIDNGNIREWIKTMTEEQVALTCGVSYSSFQKYKTKFPELQEEIDKGKKDLCGELKSKLIEKATGTYYEEVKTFIKDENGKKIKEITKIKKYLPPDIGAIHLLLKNNDESWHQDDQVVLKMKQEELELKKEINKKNEQIVQLTSSLNDLLNYVGSDNIE
jgi:hypothetical protein